MSLDTGKAAADRQAALDYHEHPKPGKLEIRATKPMATGRDLSLAIRRGWGGSASSKAENQICSCPLTGLIIQK